MGNTGGLLGTTYEGQKAVLSWNNKGKNGRVGIGSVDFSKVMMM
ncbi:hypothetical protein [Ruminiclostridium herbifermentans]|nr:hypothetical protein [Ruminiclostridium herbifermentans]